MSKSANTSVSSKHHTTKSSIRNDDFLAKSVVVPPDGGWGWAVVCASFASSMIIDGILYCFGLFLEEIAQDFGTKPTKVAIASSIMGGLYYLLGPFTCALINKYGFRAIGLAGSALSVVGLLASSTFTNLPLFIVFLGAFSGIGFNMTFSTAVLIISFYFERWRALATSIAVCGTSVGVILFPLLIAYLPDSLTWRYKFQILAGLCSLTGLFAITFKPLKAIHARQDDERPQFDVEEAESGDSVQIEHSYSIRQLYQRLHNANFPTEFDLQRSSTTITTSKLINYDSSTLSADVVAEASADGQGDKLTTVFEEDEQEIKRKTNCCKGWLLRWFSRKRNETIGNRPLYRDDIFFMGSLYTLPEYSRMTIGAGPSSKNDYHLSVTRVTTQNEVEESKKCTCCPTALKRVLATMLDFSLLKSPSFFLIVLSSFFTLLGLYVPFLFIIQRAEEMNITRTWSYCLLSIIGLSNTFGRIFCGLISSIPKSDTLIISYVTTFICGLVTIVSNYTRNLASQITFAVIFGSTIASMPAIRSVVLVELVGLDKLTNAFGIVMLFEGVASFIGVTIAGQLRDSSDSYNNSFLFAGLAILLSAVLMVPIKSVLKWEQREQYTKSKSYTLCKYSKAPKPKYTRAVR